MQGRGIVLLGLICLTSRIRTQTNKDQDKCADSTVCPPYSICINTPGSYRCNCKPGFVMMKSNRMECQDVDECSENPHRCGPNTQCTNTFGSYICSCLSGFSSPSGNSWKPGKTRPFQCTDQDECADSTVCPSYSICINTPGNYTCNCKRGFLMIKSHDNRMECQDVDECSENPFRCGPNTKCTNTFGSYICRCLYGFSSPSGNSWKPGRTKPLKCTGLPLFPTSNNCLDPMTCPNNSRCTDTGKGYYCSCNPGFALASGERIFTDPDEKCEDQDECADSTVCPSYSICINTPGNYTCNCKRGFLMMKSNDNRMECQDVDECSENPFRCGPNTKCTNIFGSYTCSCLSGFSSPNGTSWKPDINECLSETACPQHYTCWNTPGSFDCTCGAGFTFINSQCEDVDECMDVTACPAHAMCTNTPGNYSCTCNLGYKSSTSEVSFQNQGTQCKRVLVKCKEDLDQEQVQHCHSNSTLPGLPEYTQTSFCTLVDSIFNVLEDTCENKTTTVSLEKAAEKLTSVLEDASTWHNLNKKETSTLAIIFLDSVESATLEAFDSLSGNASQTVTNEYLEIESKVIQDDCLAKNLVLSAKGDSMKIECSTINESISSGTLSGITGVAFTSLLGMESILDENFFYNPEANLTSSPQRLWMNSHIIGGIITGNKKDGFSNPIIYTLENLQPKKRSDISICVSWDINVEGGRWTPKGCVTLHSTETHTQCSCNHLANMAVIMASGEITMDFALFVISHVGMILSLVCLALAIATFLLCRSIQNHNTTLHLHLCICLFLAKLLFLTGVAKTENKIVCAVIAGLLHYFFLACFAWMLVEAVMLFLMVRNLKVVNYFSSRNIKVIYLCAFGYGLPALIVVVAAGSRWEGYGMHNRCWLNTDTGFIWSFLGPVCTIIMINSILLAWTLWILRKKLSSVNAEVSTLKDNRLLTFKAFAQLFILGCSWILGIFQIGPIARTMAYLFTIINSLQGTFIFIIHCVLNRQVREEYKKCFTGKVKSSTISQSSGILLSSVPSTSKMD
ncbi:adhesion G protein-coupled receptor E1 isoform X2 [Sarcophilus harrisii]|uniref:adhesion G protein-coupled receptor E1 isoform X2 n=1 Tax=Sarcophilus harrisii TaxID=9305 RepID=UPI001301BCFA|nr:adhesion G protein-coupled receptor E1 isoform X2 [Sarcophilus harrisii]